MGALEEFLARYGSGAAELGEEAEPESALERFLREIGSAARDAGGLPAHELTGAELPPPRRGALSEAGDALASRLIGAVPALAQGGVSLLAATSPAVLAERMSAAVLPGEQPTPAADMARSALEGTANAFRGWTEVADAAAPRPARLTSEPLAAGAQVVPGMALDLAATVLTGGGYLAPMALEQTGRMQRGLAEQGVDPLSAANVGAAGGAVSALLQRVGAGRVVNPAAGMATEAGRSALRRVGSATAWGAGTSATDEAAQLGLESLALGEAPSGRDVIDRVGLGAIGGAAASAGGRLTQEAPALRRALLPAAGAPAVLAAREAASGRAAEQGVIALHRAADLADARTRALLEDPSLDPARLDEGIMAALEAGPESRAWAELPPEVADVAWEMRGHISDGTARTLADPKLRGLLSEAEIAQIDRDGGTWLHRQYAAHRDPHYLGRVRGTPIWEQAVQERAARMVPRKVAQIEAALDRHAHGDQAALEDLSTQLRRKTTITPERAAALRDEAIRRKLESSDDPTWSERVDGGEETLSQVFGAYLDSRARGAVEALFTHDPAAVAPHPPDRRDLVAFRERTVRDPTTRRLLGEIRDPELVYRATIARQAAVLELQQAHAELRGTMLGSLLFSKKDVRPGATDAVDVGESSPLYGLYGDPETVKSLHAVLSEGASIANGAATGPLAAAQQLTALSNLVPRSLAVLYSPRAYPRNAASALINAAGAGALADLDAPALARDLVTGGKVAYLHAQGEAASSPELRAVQLIAARQGILDTSVEAGLYEHYAEVVFGPPPDAGAVGDASTPVGAIAAKTRQLVRSGVPRLYQGVDNGGKVALLQARIRQYAEALPHESPRQVEDRAGAWVRATMQNYGRIPWVGQVAKNVPLIGNFTSFKIASAINVAETVRRSYADIREGISTGNAKLAKLGASSLASQLGVLAVGGVTAGAKAGMVAVAGAGAGLAAMVGADRLSRELDPGVDPEDANRKTTAALFFLPEYVQDGSYIGTSASGEVRFVDASYWDYYADAKSAYYAAVRAADRGDDPVVAAVGALVQDYVEPSMGVDILAGAVRAASGRGRSTTGRVEGAARYIGEKVSDLGALGLAKRALRSDSLEEVGKLVMSTIAPRTWRVNREDLVHKGKGVSSGLGRARGSLRGGLPGKGLDPASRVLRMDPEGAVAEAERSFGQLLMARRYGLEFWAPEEVDAGLEAGAGKKWLDLAIELGPRQAAEEWYEQAKERLLADMDDRVADGWDRWGKIHPYATPREVEVERERLERWWAASVEPLGGLGAAPFPSLR